ncbi:hypothetical protein JW865_04790 [Candidatus Bathyarchaeota archaeon]|nr:hypothetical protein [Candidatus Bathyarchaeota archaeon]
MVEEKAIKNIFIAAGPCAIESENQINDITYKMSLIRDISKPYLIHFMCRGGSWKPRTLHIDQNGEHVFEGLREEGLKIHANSAKKYFLPIVSELMSEMDLRHFHRYLDEEIDFIQIGARTNQAYALLYAVGGTDFGVMLKSPLQGIDVNESVGSLQRLENNRQIIYCVRGQKKIIDPRGLRTEAYNNYVKDLNDSPDQSPDSRNLNNIRAINYLKNNPYLIENNVLYCYDPSHTWGGKTELMKYKIGDWAIKAIIEYNYDGLMIEVNDRSAEAICDAEQALLITTNGIDWSKTNYKVEPKIPPITLVDIVSSILEFQGKKIGIDAQEIETNKKELKNIRWDATL